MVIVGAGGHASVVLDLLDSLNQYNIAGLTDPDRSKWGRLLMGFPILGDDGLLPDLMEQGVNTACLGVGSVRSEGNQFRRELFQMISQLGFALPNLQHSRATVSRFCQSGQGIVIMAGAIVNAGVTLGDNVVINTGALVEHDCLLESHSHVSPGANLAGEVRVREGAYVGIGAVVKQGVEIGGWATVGAGAVVIRDVPGGSTVVGVPARLLKPSGD